MTISVLARKAEISEFHLRRLATQGVIPSTRDERGWRVFDESVIEILKARTAKIRERQRRTPFAKANPQK